MGPRLVSGQAQSEMKSKQNNNLLVGARQMHSVFLSRNKYQRSKKTDFNASALHSRSAKSWTDEVALQKWNLTRNWGFGEFLNITDSKTYEIMNISLEHMFHFQQLLWYNHYP